MSFYIYFFYYFCLDDLNCCFGWDVGFSLSLPMFIAGVSIYSVSI